VALVIYRSPSNLQIKDATLLLTNQLTDK
jgi:hypothetical protein